jgi:hypothetical protein
LVEPFHLFDGITATAKRCCEYYHGNALQQYSIKRVFVGRIHEQANYLAALTVVFSLIQHPTV